MNPYVVFCLSFSGINESYQMGLFQVLAAILHLGNVEIKDRDADSSLIAVRINFSLQGERGRVLVCRQKFIKNQLRGKSCFWCFYNFLVAFSYDGRRI